MILELKQKPTILISKEVLSIITYFHSKEKVEWSGSLFYSVQSGSIEDPDNLVLKAEYIHLMDIGSSAYTEFDMSADLFMSVFENNPSLEEKLMGGELRIGYVHSHHVMQTTPSGTDTDELLSNSKHFPYYLSLIVNYSGNYSARIAIKGKYQKKTLENKFSFSNVESAINFKEENNDQEVIAVMNCNIVFEIPESIEKQYNTIKTLVKKPAYSSYPYNSGSYNSGSVKNGGWTGNREQVPPASNQTSLGFTKDTETLAYTKFLVNWLSGDKNSEKNLYQAVIDFSQIFKKANKSNVKNIISHRKESFSRVAQSFIGKKPNKTELDDLATELSSWLRTYSSYAGINELLEVLDEFIIIDNTSSYGYNGSNWDSRTDWYY
jgi:proteasome lid subunit RPN8/RPN11